MPGFFISVYFVRGWRTPVRVRKICPEQILTAERSDAGPKGEAQVDNCSCIIDISNIHVSQMCWVLPEGHRQGLAEHLEPGFFISVFYSGALKQFDKHQGRICSRQISAFPPSMEVRWRECRICNAENCSCIFGIPDVLVSQIQFSASPVAIALYWLLYLVSFPRSSQRFSERPKSRYWLSSVWHDSG